MLLCDVSISLSLLQSDVGSSCVVFLQVKACMRLIADAQIERDPVWKDNGIGSIHKLHCFETVMRAR